MRERILRTNQDMQAQRPAGRCEFCWGEIYPGEPQFHWEGGVFHPSCFGMYLASRLSLSLAEEEGICDHCGQAIARGEEIRRPFSLLLHDDCLPLWAVFSLNESKGGNNDG